MSAAEETAQGAHERIQQEGADAPHAAVRDFVEPMVDPFAPPALIEPAWRPPAPQAQPPQAQPPQAEPPEAQGLSPHAPSQPLLERARAWAEPGDDFAEFLVPLRVGDPFMRPFAEDADPVQDQGRPQAGAETEEDLEPFEALAAAMREQVGWPDVAPFGFVSHLPSDLEDEAEPHPLAVSAATGKTAPGAAAPKMAPPPPPPPAPEVRAPDQPQGALRPGAPGADAPAAAPAEPVPRADAAAPPGVQAKARAGSAGEDPGFTGVDVEVFSRNVARLMEEGGKAMAAYLTPRDAGKTDDMAEDIADAMRTVGHVAEYWMADPQRTLEAQSRLMSGYLSVWANTVKRLAGEDVPPVAAPDPKDARFKDAGWSVNPMFDALKQAYLVTTHWAEDMVGEAEGLDAHTKHKAEFLVRQIANAISPSNFVLTNPELIRETLTSSGENLVKGMKNFTEDLIEGGGTLKIRQTDTRAFEVGRNLATTPGKVIFENELMQLIQYESTTARVKKTPVLLVPPWINKYYILDLTPEKSLIKWLVDQGHTVFTISWVNPDARLAAKGFDDYMRDGIMAALDAVAVASGERRVHAVGYCVGGTLLAVTLAYMAATADDRIASATFLTTQIDFTHAGDLKVFVDEAQLATLERKMKELGYLEGSKMASAFNLLRSNDLIWPYVVNNYMKGKAPFPFDLLYWNSDSTRMPAANHSYYLRNCYLSNNIASGRAELAGIRVDMTKVSIPVYSLATREDHIAPAKSVYIGANLLSGPVRYVLAGSGHIAGVVNQPAKMKYQYWADGPAGPSYEAWLEGAHEHKGSWWPDWLQWFGALHPEEVEARAVGGGRLTPIEDAPGRYVKERA